MPDRSIDVLRREMLAVLNRAEQATAWEHRARARRRPFASWPITRRTPPWSTTWRRSSGASGIRSPSDGRPPEQDVARIDALLERYDAATRKRYGGS